MQTTGSSESDDQGRKIPSSAESRSYSLPVYFFHQSLSGRSLRRCKVTLDYCRASSRGTGAMFEVRPAGWQTGRASWWGGRDAVKVHWPQRCVTLGITSGAPSGGGVGGYTWPWLAAVHII